MSNFSVSYLFFGREVEFLFYVNSHLRLTKNRNRKSCNEYSSSKCYIHAKPPAHVKYAIQQNRKDIFGKKGIGFLCGALIVQSSFTVVISTPKGNKVAGTCEIDLAPYLNQNIKGSQKYEYASSNIEKQEVLSLSKCPDPNAKLYLNMKFTQLEEVADHDRYININVLES